MTRPTPEAVHDHIIKKLDVVGSAQDLSELAVTTGQVLDDPSVEQAIGEGCSRHELVRATVEATIIWLAGQRLIQEDRLHKLAQGIRFSQ